MTSNKIRGVKGTFQENKEITKWVEENQNKHLCACECGNYIQIKRVHFRTGIPKYIYGHNSITHKEEIAEQVKKFYQTEEGKKQALEHGKFMEEYYKTHDAYWKNHPMPKEMIEKQSRTKKERFANGEIIQHQKGKTFEEMYGKEKAEELKRISSQKLKGKTGKLALHWGKKHTEKSKIEMSKKRKGALPWNDGKKDVYSKETKRKLSLAKGGTGIPYEDTEYGIDFDSGLKEQIRLRDDYKCKLCGCSQVENGRQLDIHHINYKKRENILINLVALCIRCHAKTKVNRKYWTEFFTSLLEKTHGVKLFI